VANIGADNWVWYGWNCIKLKVFVSIQGACATIERIWTKLKPFQIPN
jgi:IS1 family transposase